MTQFIQIHALVSYAPANLNRDDLGRPKSARMGGVMRMRASSQSLKRAWRTSELFQQAMAGTIGTRTKLLGKKVLEDLMAGKIEEKEAKEILLLYRNIAIPLHHVLSRRIGRYSSPLIIGQDSLLDRFLTRNLGDLHQIEAMIEDYATECLKRIVSFIQKHQEVIKNKV